MIAEYISAALARATYEKIEDKRNPYYGRVPTLKGVWATGKSLEECRNHLADVIEGWLIVRLRKGLPIPPVGKNRVRAARAPNPHRGDIGVELLKRILKTVSQEEWQEGG